MDEPDESYVPVRWEDLRDLIELTAATENWLSTLCHEPPGGVVKELIDHHRELLMRAEDMLP